MRTSMRAGSFVNGRPVWSADVINDIDGERGSFAVPTATARTPFRIGEAIDIDMGASRHAGVITRIAVNSLETQVEWRDPAAITKSVWRGWSASEIIDGYAKELALKRPA
jgi:hypothetical protein